MSLSIAVPCKSVQALLTNTRHDRRCSKTFCLVSALQFVVARDLLDPMWTEVYASGYKQYRLVQLGPAVRTNDEPEQAAVVTHLTL